MNIMDQTKDTKEDLLSKICKLSGIPKECLGTGKQQGVGVKKFDIFCGIEFGEKGRGN